MDKIYYSSVLQENSSGETLGFYHARLIVQFDDGDKAIIEISAEENKKIGIVIKPFTSIPIGTPYDVIEGQENWGVLINGIEKSKVPNIQQFSGFV